MLEAHESIDKLRVTKDFDPSLKEEARQVALFYLDEEERRVLRENDDLKKTNARIKKMEEAAQR